MPLTVSGMGDRLLVSEGTRPAWPPPRRPAGAGPTSRSWLSRRAAGRATRRAGSRTLLAGRSGGSTTWWPAPRTSSAPCASMCAPSTRWSGSTWRARKAEVHNRAHGRTFQLGFDLLHVATGARPRRPDLPGMDLPHVHGVQTLDDAAALVRRGEERRPRRRGSSSAVATSAWSWPRRSSSGARRSPSSKPEPEVMGTLDPDMGGLVARALRDTGITVRVGRR